MKAAVMLALSGGRAALRLPSFWLENLVHVPEYGSLGCGFWKGKRRKPLSGLTRRWRENMTSPSRMLLKITDKNSLRTFIMNVIRGGLTQIRLSSIALALNSEDSETAHYAASVLQDVLSEFRSNVQEKICQMPGGR